MLEEPVRGSVARSNAPVEPEDLETLADHLDGLALVLSGAAAPELRRERDRLVRLLRGVVSRASTPDAPLLVVVGGGSGAGKSTLVNTLAGRRITPGGVVRPTTRAPVLVCHPDDLATFTPQDGVLPGMVRVEAERGEQVVGERTLLLATSSSLPAGVALLDTPDIDTVEHRNRELAEQALDAADVWFWLATARTYADEVGMGYLRRAARRQALLALVLNQVPDAHREVILEDATRLLEAHAAMPDRRVVVPRTTIADDRLPDGTLASLTTWLHELAPLERRRSVRAVAVAGLRAAVPAEVAALAAGVEVEVGYADRLRGLVTNQAAAVAVELDAELDAGLSLRAEVLDNWRQVVGGAAWLERAQGTATELGALVRARLGMAGPAPSEDVQVEVAAQLVRVLDRLLTRTHLQLRWDLEADPAGLALLDHTPELRSEPVDRTVDLERLVEAWQAATTALLVEVGAPRKRRAWWTSVAVSSATTSAILVLFSVSGGLTGGEVGLAAAAAAASQWLLTKVLGERNVERLLDAMRADLQERVGARLAEEHRGYLDAIDAVRPSTAAVEALAGVTEGRS